MLPENELKKLKICCCFRGKNCFEDGTQNYLVFQPMYRYFQRLTAIGSGNYVYYWKSKGLSHENITAPSAPNNVFNLSLEFLVLNQE